MKTSKKLVAAVAASKKTSKRIAVAVVAMKSRRRVVVPACSKCGRVNTTGRNCRTASACRSRRLAA